LDRLYSAYTELGDEGLGAFLKLYRLMKEKGMSIEQVVNAVYAAIHILPYIENLYEQVKEQVQKMQGTIQRLANDIAGLEHKISILDKTASSCEQDCKRAEQKVQELTAKKDRIEKLIATMLSDGNEDYTKLKSIVKENVKAILANNKQLISVSFVAIIQTLKADPQIVKLIQNMPSANDDKQLKDNNNNITKYLEFNKDRIMDFAEKHYENLVEALANNVISATASSNPKLSLAQSSFTFSNPYNQSDTYRIEEPEIYDADDDNKGDMAN